MAWHWEADRGRAWLPGELLAAFVDHLGQLGLLPAGPDQRAVLHQRVGGWIKLGLIGTEAARGRVLLAGDAAGLVNPLQGEGIGQAMSSGHLAA